MFIVELLKSLPKEGAIILGAAIPVTEVRATVPLGIIYFKMPALNVIALSVIGNVLPVFPLLWFLNTLTERLRKIKFWDQFFEWLFSRTRAKSKLIADFELIGLALFIGVPFPGTGVWTGVIAAYLLGLRWIPIFFCALAGSLIACLAMWLLSAGILRLF